MPTTQSAEVQFQGRGPLLPRGDVERGRRDRPPVRRKQYPRFRVGRQGDANGNSDLLIDARAETGLFDLTGFALGVEQLMAVFTQVVTVPGLKPRIRDRVVDSAVPL